MVHGGGPGSPKSVQNMADFLEKKYGVHTENLKFTHGTNINKALAIVAPSLLTLVLATIDIKSFPQDQPDSAIKTISSYKHKDESFKSYWGHSMGADSLAIMFGNKNFNMKVDEINLVFPRVRYVLSNLEEMAKKAETVNIYVLKGDINNFLPGYGDRSAETLVKKLSDIPDNVNIIVIQGCKGTQCHGGACNEGIVFREITSDINSK